MDGLVFGVGLLCFSLESESTTDRQSDIARAVDLPGVDLVQCWFDQSRTEDTEARKLLTLPRSVSASVPASGLVLMRINVSHEKQREYLRESEPDTGTEDFELSIRYGPLYPTAFAACVNGSPAARGSHALRVVAGHLDEWWRSKQVTERTNVNLHSADLFPFPLDAILVAEEHQQQRFGKTATTLTPVRLDSFAYSTDSFSDRQLDALWHLQKAMQYETSHLIYEYMLAQDRRTNAHGVRASAKELIEFHTDRQLASKLKRLFRGGQAQDLSLLVLDARKITSDHDLFHKEVLLQTQLHAELVAFTDIADLVASWNFEAELVYAEHAADVMEALRRSDFQVYMAALVASLAAILTLLTRIL